jgi:hypothetical protein
MDELRRDLENGDMPLDQRLQDMGLDPKEYKAYGHEHTRVAKTDIDTVQFGQQYGESRATLPKMGTQDARRSTAKVERVAEYTRPLDIIEHVQERRSRAYQSRKVRLSHIRPRLPS